MKGEFLQQDTVLTRLGDVDNRKSERVPKRGILSQGGYGGSEAQMTSTRLMCVPITPWAR